MRLFVLLTVTFVLAFAPAPLPRREQRRINDSYISPGRWDFELWENSGRSSAFSQYLDITEDKVTFRSLNGPGEVTYDFILHRNMKPPGFEWKTNHGSHWVGSYRVEGGSKLTLIFRSSRDINQRLTDFSDPRPEYRFVLNRK